MNSLSLGAAQCEALFVSLSAHHFLFMPLLDIGDDHMHEENAKPADVIPT